MKITGNKARATLSANGKRCGVYISGPNSWVPGVNPDLIKVRFKKHIVPAEILAAFDVENNSDSQTDYFEKGSIRLLPGHPLYEAAKAISCA